MRAIAEPKYDMRVVATGNCSYNSDSKKMTKDMITAFKTATLGIGSAITFYVDFLNSSTIEGGIFNDNFQ